MINQASINPQFENHPGLKQYGIESYIAVPLYRLNGEFFGTLCALDPLPVNLTKPDLEMFDLFAKLIAYELETADQQVSNEEALKLAEQSSERRARFMGILGHDLRSPLNTILMAATLQHQGSLDREKNIELADKIIKTGKRMQYLIEDLLDTTQTVQGNEIYIERKPSDLNEIFSQIIDELRISNPHRQINFFAEDKFSGNWDAERLKQVLSNLLSNALHYGKPLTAIDVNLTKQADKIVLQVVNQGRVIPEDVRKNLFTPFWRGAKKNSSNPNSSGLGLGLYIVKQIVQAHGAMITVESSREDGTIFSVIFVSDLKKS